MEGGKVGSGSRGLKKRGQGAGLGLERKETTSRKRIAYSEVDFVMERGNDNYHARDGNSAS